MTGGLGRGLPSRVSPVKAITRATVHSLAEAIATGEGAGEEALRLLAERIIRAKMEDWAVSASAEITSVTTAAMTKALKDWRKKRGNLEHEVVQLVASADTRRLMDEWAAAAVTQVEAELDGRGLITTDVLEALSFNRPARKVECRGAKTDGLEATDEECFAWWVAQVNDLGVSVSNRLRGRLLCAALLDFLRGADATSGWRNPILGS